MYIDLLTLNFESKRLSYSKCSMYCATTSTLVNVVCIVPQLVP